MTGFNHTLAGAVIAITAPTPLAPLASLLSHFVLDMLPHFGRHKDHYPYSARFIRALALDGVISLLCVLLALLLFPDKWTIIGVCVALSVLPDALWLFRGKAPWLENFLDVAEKIQWGERPWGMTLEIIYAICFVLILIYLS